MGVRYVSRLNWKLGRLVELHVGKDWEVRSIDMKTALGKTVTRPMQGKGGCSVRFETELEAR